MTSLTSTTPRWLPPAEREDMWERVLREYDEDLKRNPPPPKPPTRLPTEAEREEGSCGAITEGLREANEEVSFGHAAAAAWGRVFEPGRYPRLHLAGGKRAGRTGMDRFRGRYVPHLVWDRDRIEPRQA